VSHAQEVDLKIMLGFQADFRIVRHVNVGTAERDDVTDGEEENALERHGDVTRLTGHNVEVRLSHLLPIDVETRPAVEVMPLLDCSDKGCANVIVASHRDCKCILRLAPCARMRVDEDFIERSLGVVMSARVRGVECRVKVDGSGAPTVPEDWEHRQDSKSKDEDPENPEDPASGQREHLMELLELTELSSSRLVVLLSGICHCAQMRLTWMHMIRVLEADSLPMHMHPCGFITKGQADDVTGELRPNAC